ncbi:MAG: hypothetical protein GY749_41195 [Desulfobacteraceae bacterium]|nr:hypothetical protein [Desulfobacteraceae bacterium]
MGKILFDKGDYDLLNIVSEVRSKERSLKYPKKYFYPYFHPHGIKEMVESKGMRIATAVIYLLDSLEAGKIDDRLIALRCLRDEVLNAAYGPLPRNTARVLLEIMKELVRTEDNYTRQLELAHDFRTATSGRPRIIRTLLRRYHLLEMPEEWNQIAFDDHVHDANTKGRKSATHLVMDAWIKGIRYLKVVYYNYIKPMSAAELLEAAAIMGIHVRIGIEFSAKFRNKYIQLIWTPKGFPDSQAFLCFLAEKSVIELMDKAREVSEYQEKHVMAILKAFNETHRHEIGKHLGIDVQPVDKAEFINFVGAGQASLLHLGIFIHASLLPVMQKRVSLLREKYKNADNNEQNRIENLINEMNLLNSEAIVEQYLTHEKNPDIPCANIPQDTPDTPELLKASPCEVIDNLAKLHTGYRITLNLSNVKAEDVLELLYDCEGAIDRLEIFNLKDYADGSTDHISEISELQSAINKGNVIVLKRLIRGIIEHLKTSDYPDKQDRVEKISNILHDIITVKTIYKAKPLKSRIGSDSSGQSAHVHGMGLAIKETLPRKAQLELKKPSVSQRDVIPISVKTHLRTTYIPVSEPDGFISDLLSRLYYFSVLRILFQKQKDWFVHQQSVRLGPPGNIVTLGGVHSDKTNGLSLSPPRSEKKKQQQAKFSWKYLNTGVKNALKVLTGFIPAFATFAIVYEWWLLAYFGAVIWFSITGLRNILQSVLGGGGFKRSPLLHWNDYVSWGRIADSLLFTGFSVPLLDYLVKKLFLDQYLGINTTTNPIMLYAIMALANGIYISSHNAFRGLPKRAIFGNFFRSILSIPLAIEFNEIIGYILGSVGVVGVNSILQKWAAVISKLASDCIAGIIEGMADRHDNLHMRKRDYKDKFDQLFDIYAEMEMLFPEDKVLEMLSSPKKLADSPKAEVHDLENIIIINALDMLYFWMFQPRARNRLNRSMRLMSSEERQVFIRSQFILQRHEDISLMFVNGILGKNFMKALAFYLDHSEEYLKAIKKKAESFRTYTD